MAAVAAVVALNLFEPRPVWTMVHQAYDALAATQARPPGSDAVAIVDIDDDSLASVGQWPWPRIHLARMLDRLWDAGARVVVFDITFPEPDRTSPARIRELWSGVSGAPVELGPAAGAVPDFDASFAKALARGPSVLGCYLAPSDAPSRARPPAGDGYRGRFFERNKIDRAMLPQAAAIVQSIPVLATSATATAFFNTTCDFDQIVRRTPLVWAWGADRVYPSLALEAVRLYRGLPNFGMLYDQATGTRLESLQLRDAAVAVDGNGRLLLNYRTESFPRLSAGAVLRGEFDPAAVSNRILFVGTSAAGLKDLVATPLSAEFPGVEVHATAADNILAGDALREPAWFYFVNLAAIFLVGLLVTWSAAGARSWAAALLAAGIAVAAAAAGIAALRFRGWTASPVEAVVTAFLVYMCVTAVRFGQEERARRRVRAMFGTMVSDDVLHYLEDHPQSFALAGERREVTVLFTDLAGFTTVSENMEPARLSELMNFYLTPMTDLVLARRGFVNKFVGDAIMAVWGAPYDVPDHAAQACGAALEMQRRLDEMRVEIFDRFGCELRMRIGINTGPVTAGNMGSHRRFEYTVLGDTVNQAARFEGANKSYGTRILIGETTRLAAGDRIEAREVDTTIVKGRTRPVKVFELLALRG